MAFGKRTLTFFRQLTIPLLILPLLACHVAPTRATVPTSSSSAVLRAEHDRFAAMVSGDFTALDTLLADDLVYTHTDGLTQTKAQFLETLRSHSLVYLSITPAGVQVLPLADGGGVITGRSHMQLRAQGSSVEFDIRFVDVVLRQGSRLLCVRWQSTRLQP